MLLDFESGSDVGIVRNGGSGFNVKLEYSPVARNFQPICRQETGSRAMIFRKWPKGSRSFAISRVRDDVQVVEQIPEGSRKIFLRNHYQKRDAARKSSAAVSESSR